MTQDEELIERERLSRLRDLPTNEITDADLAWWLRQPGSVVPTRIRAFVADRLEALAQPVAGVSADDVERDIRIAIWNAGMNGGMGQDLSQAFIVRAMAEPTMIRALAALAASPSPVVGDREAIADVAEAAALEAADNIERHLLNPAMIWGLPELPESWTTELRSIAVAQMEQAATTIADAILSLSTPVVGGDQGLRNSARAAVMYLETGFIECEQCGHEVQPKDLDATYELRDALAALSTPVAEAAQEQDIPA